MTSIFSNSRSLTFSPSCMLSVAFVFPKKVSSNRSLCTNEGRLDTNFGINFSIFPNRQQPRKFRFLCAIWDDRGNNSETFKIDQKFRVDLQTIDTWFLTESTCFAYFMGSDRGKIVLTIFFCSCWFDCVVYIFFFLHSQFLSFALATNTATAAERTHTSISWLIFEWKFNAIAFSAGTRYYIE